MIDEKNLQLLERSWRRSFLTYPFFSQNQCSDSLFAQLLKAYSESQRKYHTLQHLMECLTKFERVFEQTDHPREIEVALWFHDAIYDVKGHDNERLSAAWAKKSVLDVGGAIAESDRIYHLIMITQHSAFPQTIDEKILVDIDLSILGETEERFAEYDRQVRQEYAWVADEIFKEKRREILEGFLARPQIFNSEYFFTHFERSARKNLKRAISQL
ncbi:metal-dependent hydrolase [Aquirhabdus sp.]|uniref:HD domain-containing protein n=1 Tax=Aquirhabdus sp. TaxID=2824160 RepID=UPI00396C3C9F